MVNLGNIVGHIIHGVKHEICAGVQAHAWHQGFAVLHVQLNCKMSARNDPAYFEQASRIFFFSLCSGGQASRHSAAYM